MEWIVRNTLNRDTERQHLNRILADIRATIDSASTTSSGTVDGVEATVGAMVEGNSEQGVNVTYDPDRGVLDFSVNEFIIKLTGDVTGQGIVTGLRNVSIPVTIDPDVVGVEEAPIDNHAYWRVNAGWEVVPAQLWTFSSLEGTGFPAQGLDSQNRVIYTIREFEAEPGELVVSNPTGDTGNPKYGLADLTDTGIGTSPVKLITRDAKGRVEGTQDASTDDLPEGAANLYFTDERAQDAIGAAIAAGTGDGVTLDYNDALNSIGVTNTDKGSAAVAAHETALDPHPQYALESALGTAAYTDSTAYATAAQGTLADSAVQPGDNISTLTNDSAFVNAAGASAAAPIQSIVAGTNVTVDVTDPANPVISSSGGGGGGTVDSVVAGTGIDVDSTDPANPIVALNGTSIASLALADSSVQPGDNISGLANDAGYVTSSGVTSIGVTAPITSSGGTAPTIGISAATAVAAGSMSAADKIKLGLITSGTYTPTLTNTTNVSSSSTPSDWQYIRVGSVVTVSGQLNFSPTAAGAIEVQATLPIASNFAAFGNCAGAASVRTGGVLVPVQVTADTTTDRVRFIADPTTTAPHVTFVNFTYLII